MAGETGRQSERGTRGREKEGREEGRHRPRRENTARAAINQGKAHGARNPGRDGPALARSQGPGGRTVSQLRGEDVLGGNQQLLPEVRSLCRTI